MQRIGHLAKTLLVAAAGLAAGGAWASAFSGTFSYYADGTDVKTVMANFARAQGLEAGFDGDVSGPVRGRFNKISARAFLETMGEAYDFGWYVLGGTLHFYPRGAFAKEFLTVPAGSGPRVIASLKRSGFVAAELPVATNAEGNMLTISGPAAYVDQVKAAASAYLAAQAERIEMRVFPLKHAWAADIDLTSSDQTVTVPGIASILRGMVMGQSVAGETVQKTRSAAEGVPSLGARGLSKQSESREKHRAAPAADSEGAIPRGSVSIIADPRVNAVLVSDAAYRMPYYEKVIADLDKPVELVEIHAAIVDIDTDASRNLGINFRGQRGNGNWQGGGTMGGGSGGDSTAVTTSGSAGALLSTIYTHGSDFFMARINALESKNAARMLGRPSVLTVDNVQAVLENTTTYYIPLRGTEAVDLYKVEAGTVLRVTPHIIHENGRTQIKLAVSVQDDQSDGSSGYQSIGGENSDSITVSPIKQTKINTQAMVEVGQSLLIGGYYYEQRSKGNSGVPILKDIPYLGALFRSSSTSSRQMERLILITPRLVTPQEANVPQRVNAGGFGRTATQADYEGRVDPAAPASVTPAPVAPAALPAPERGTE